MSEADYYRVLEVEPTASDEELKKAYRRLIRLYHPDLNSDSDAENKLICVINAYQLLGNPKRRATYDALTQMYGSAPVKSPARRPDAPRIYQSTSKPSHQQFFKLFSICLVACITVASVIAGWRSMSDEAHIKTWRITPAKEGYLSAPGYISYERGDRTADLERAYLRSCADAYRQNPSDPASAERLASAYLSAAERALQHRDPDQAEVLANAAFRVMGGDYPPASAMLRTLFGSQIEVATVSTYTADDFSEIE